MKSLLPPRQNAAFSPPDQSPLEVVTEGFERWGKRILVLVSLLGVLGAYANYSGWRRFGPAAAESAISGLRDTMHYNSRRIDAVEQDARSSVYLLCELFRANQPTAIQPEICSPERQQRRRVVP